MRAIKRWLARRGLLCVIEHRPVPVKITGYRADGMILPGVDGTVEFTEAVDGDYVACRVCRKVLA